MENLDHRIVKDRITNIDRNKVDRFICPDCSFLIQEPRKCGVCPTHYCRACIEKNINNNTKCLRCKSILTSEDPENYLRTELAEMIIQCQFSSFGCNEKVLYESIVLHEKRCKFKHQVCGKCIEKFNYRDYNDHILKCNKENYILLDNGLKSVEKKSLEELNKIKLFLHKNLGEILVKTLVFEKNILVQNEEISNISKKFPINSDIVGNNIKNSSQKLTDLFNNLKFNECKVFYYCKGTKNSCFNNGNVNGFNPYRINSCLCSAGRQSNLIDENGGLFEVQRIANTNEMLLIGVDLIISVLNLTQDDCGYMFGVCVGKQNNRCNSVGDVWGDNPYSGDSNVCLSSLNSGVIGINGGVFKIDLKPGQNQYNSSHANNVITLSYGYYINSIYISKL